MEDNYKSRTALDKSFIYHNAEMLLKALEFKGQLTVKSILEALKHYIKKIEALSVENELFRNKLKQCPPERGATDIAAMKHKINELQKQVTVYREIQDDRNELKAQINKMASTIKQLSFKNHHFLNGQVSYPTSVELQYVGALLDKMLGIEGKIIEYKQKAANTSHLRKEVEKLRNDLQEQRSKEIKRIQTIINQYNRKMDLAGSQFETCKKERDMYEKLTKKLEIEAKKAINERILYEAKAQELECKYDKLLFELEKTKTRNTELLVRSPIKRDSMTKELKTALEACRHQRDAAVKRSVDYEKKLKTASRIITHLRGTRLSQGYFINGEMKGSKRTSSHIQQNSLECVTTTVQENFESETPRQQDTTYRYWRKVSKNFNLLLKISPHPPPPSGFKRKFLIKSRRDIQGLMEALAPNEEAINGVIKIKTEQELCMAEHKAVVERLASEIQNTFLGMQTC